jgi:TPR repeat protein
MYENGRGVPQDYSEAARWYRIAAEQGVAYAQNNLGILYQRGRGVQQSYAEAARWFLRGAEQGDEYAQNNLGTMYEYGQGVPQDYVEGYMWLNIAAARVSGDDQRRFADDRDRLAAKMTAQQILEAQRLARDWNPQK